MSTPLEGAPRTEQHELLDSVSFVYKGKTKERFTVKRDYKDWFWVGSFQMTPDFRGTPKQKESIRDAYGEVLGRPSMLQIDSSGDTLSYSCRIGDERTDQGVWFDEKCERIARILNNKQTKDTVAAYLVFFEQKEKLRLKLAEMKSGDL